MLQKEINNILEVFKFFLIKKVLCFVCCALLLISTNNTYSNLLYKKLQPTVFI